MKVLNCDPLIVDVSGRVSPLSRTSFKNTLVLAYGFGDHSEATVVINVLEGESFPSTMENDVRGYCWVKCDITYWNSFLTRVSANIQRFWP